MQYTQAVLSESVKDELVTSTNQTLLLPGWGQLLSNHQTRGLVLLALINIILESYTAPTGMEILERVQLYQKELEVPTLSRNSLRIVLTHIGSLIDDGYVFKTSFTDRDDGLIGRGGRSRSYWPNCIGLSLLQEIES